LLLLHQAIRVDFDDRSEIDIYLSTMNSEPDLRHAISLRPSPFHPHPYRADVPTHAEHHIAAQGSATSTGVQPAAAPGESLDPIVRHNAKQAADIEGQSQPHYTNENDPFRLSTRLKSAEEISQIRPNSSRRRVACAPLSVNKEAWRARKIRGFYEAQNENIERLLKPVDEHRRQAKAEQGENHLQYQIAVQGSFAANIILAGLQLYGAASSGSLSLFTTMADALFDPLSNLTLILSNRAVNRVDPRKFPSGKARIETAGNITFCFLMCAVSFIIIVMAARELAEGFSGDTKGFHLPSVVAVVIAFCTKLGLFIYCYALRNKYSQIRILWEDHRNDLLINGFGLLTSVGGSKLKWWIDPMGAIILSCLIVFLWLRTAWSEFQLLIGVSADTEMLQLITYICKSSRLISAAGLNNN
jgi:divalent metal cation (Fe/Co/Zn/Cd) transporter